eukprot:690482-Rhodomonas_salina.1
MGGYKPCASSPAVPPPCASPATNAWRAAAAWPKVQHTPRLRLVCQQSERARGQVRHIRIAAVDETAPATGIKEGAV